MLQSPLRNGRCVSTFPFGLFISALSTNEPQQKPRLTHSFISFILSFAFSIYRFDFWCFCPHEKSHSNHFSLYFISMIRFLYEDEKKKLRNNHATENKMHFQHDDKNSHFVIASTIAPADQPFIFPGGMQRTNPQSQSFPDLSRKIDSRSMKGVGGGGGGSVRPMYKSSRLPVASRYVDKRNSSSRLNRRKCVASSWPIACCFSCVCSSHFRFPSMESNIEVRSTGNTKSEFNNLYNTSNRAIYSNQRLNRSLPRKFKTTSIPVRHFYPNYSHGKFQLFLFSSS